MDDTLLKRAFLVDGVGCLASTAVLVGAAGALAEPLGLSAQFLTITGWLLLPVALLFLLIARTGSRPLAAVGVAGNLAWILASAAVIPILQPTMLGVAVIMGQALLVLDVAWFEWRGLKRAKVMGA